MSYEHIPSIGRGSITLGLNVSRMTLDGLFFPVSVHTIPSVVIQAQFFKRTTLSFLSYSATFTSLKGSYPLSCITRLQNRFALRAKRLSIPYGRDLGLFRLKRGKSFALLFICIVPETCFPRSFIFFWKTKCFTLLILSYHGKKLHFANKLCLACQVMVGACLCLMGSDKTLSLKVGCRL